VFLTKFFELSAVLTIKNTTCERENKDLCLWKYINNTQGILFCSVIFWNISLSLEAFKARLDGALSNLI